MTRAILWVPDADMALEDVDGVARIDRCLATLRDGFIYHVLVLTTSKSSELAERCRLEHLELLIDVSDVTAEAREFADSGDYLAPHVAGLRGENDLIWCDLRLAIDPEVLAEFTRTRGSVIGVSRNWKDARFRCSMDGEFVNGIARARIGRKQDQPAWIGLVRLEAEGIQSLYEAVSFELGKVPSLGWLFAELMDRQCRSGMIEAKTFEIPDGKWSRVDEVYVQPDDDLFGDC